MVKRAFTLNEFVQVIDILRGMKNTINRYSITSYFIFQYNMIGCIDDVSHVYMDSLKGSYEYPYALKINMGWSKNVI